MTPSTEESPLRSTSNESSYPRATYAWYVVGVLAFVYVFSFLDRTILNLLVGPIRRDLAITDTQMSLLIGFAFALFYVAFGIPLGRLADSRSRRGLITAGFALWSFFTAGCGLAGNYAQLLVMRMGVGVGEASLGPAAYSLITDYFPPRRRGLAMGIYHVGVYAGVGIAFLVGGLVTALVARQPAWDLPILGTVRSWQMVFIVIGFAGLVSVPVMATVREPRRREARAEAVPLSEVLAHYKKNGSAFLCLHLSFALLALSGYGAAAWMPSFFIRHHHWTAAQFGLVNGLILTFGGSLAACLSGLVADRLAARGRRDAFYLVAAVGASLWSLFGTAQLLAPNGTLAAILFAPAASFYATQTGMGPAALMQITPARMRGQAGAIYLFVLGVIGAGLGPTAVALCTDYIFHNDDMVGYSILLVAMSSSGLAALLLWFGRNAFVGSQDRMVETPVALAATQ